jgi:hypothetical protein
MNTSNDTGSIQSGKVKITFVMIIILILTVSIGCSGKKETRDENIKSVKSKIDLLFLKYDVDSDNLKKELLEYLYLDFQKIPEDKFNKMDESTQDLLSGYVIDTEKIISMSKKYNVPISKISGIVYDYMIWEKLIEIDDSLPGHG